MHIEELLPGINLENERVEFKLRLESGIGAQKGDDLSVNWLKEIVAFSNSLGGTIYVGVDDKKHNVSPLTSIEFDKAANLVYSELRNKVEPNISVKIEEIPISDSVPTSYVMKIEVPASKQVPVFVHMNGIPVAFIRKFGRSEAANFDELRNLFVRSSGPLYDLLPTEKKASIDDFLAYGRIYENSNGKKLTMRTLEASEMVDDKGFLTKGGHLFADQCKDELTLLKMTYYKGIDRGGDYVYAEEDFRGPLFECVNKAVEFVKNHSNIGYRKTPTSRVDYFSYPERSVFEGIVNAYAHRNFFIDGSQVSIDIFLDRLEITSPGSLNNGKIYKGLRDISSIEPNRRNRVICAAFRNIKYMEEKGSGFEKISADYVSVDEKHLPFIDADGMTLTLTLPDLTYKDGIVKEFGEAPEIVFLENSVAVHDKKILSYCYAKERTLVEIASYLGIAPSTYLRSGILGKLQEASLLYSTQRGKTIFYRTNTSAIDLKEN